MRSSCGDNRWWLTSRSAKLVISKCHPLFNSVHCLQLWMLPNKTMVLLCSYQTYKQFMHKNLIRRIRVSKDFFLWCSRNLLETECQVLIFDQICAEIYPLNLLKKTNHKKFLERIYKAASFSSLKTIEWKAKKLRESTNMV